MLRELSEQVAAQIETRDAIRALSPGGSSIAAVPRPYPPRLRPVTITDLTGPRPTWLSRDGETMFGALGSVVHDSADDWATTRALTTIPSLVGGMYVHSVRQLDAPNGEPGELLALVRYDVANSRPGEVWRSSGYPTVGAAATWSKVLTCSVGGAAIDEVWGFSCHDNLVMLSEYGVHGDAIRAYLSVDYGVTYATVYTMASVSGPAGTHIHGCAVDPYRGWLWLVTGDGPASRGTYVSRDLGATWETVDTEHQPVGIMPMPDGVILTSDKAPNGAYFVPCTGDARQELVATLLYALDTATDLTYVGGQHFQRDYGYPALLPWVRSGTGRARLLATVDGRTYHELWTDWRVGTVGGMQIALGPTALGNVVCMLNSTGRATTFSLLRAPFPEWRASPLVAP